MRILEATLAAVLLLIAVGLFASTFSGAFDVPTFGGDVGPAFAPRGYLLVWIALAMAVTVQALRRDDEPLGSVGNIPLVMTASAISVGTGLAMLKVGFVIAAVPGFFLFCRALGYRNYIVLALISVLAPLAIWWVFTFVFELLLPRSPWFGRL